jgi:hypothetical protein
MPGTLPTIRGGSAAIYPVQRDTLISTGVQRFLNASEQRFKKHAPLGQFQLVYKSLFAVDRDALKQFYADTKGSFDSTWSFTLVNTYATCTFLQDGFSSVEGKPNLYDVTLRFRQVQNLTPAAATATSGSGNATGLPSAPGGSRTDTLQQAAIQNAIHPAFPRLSTGATSQRPYTQTVRYRTTLNDMPSGQRYSYAWYDAGLPGFPTRGLMAWKLEFPSVTDDDMAMLEAFFVQVNGRWRHFSFTDPEDGVTYQTVRFDQDSFTYRYLALNQASTTLQLVETN